MRQWAFSLVFLLILTIGITPEVDAGPITAMTCALSCCGGACAGAAAVCMPLGAATGPLALPTAISCLVMAGGGCTACALGCVAVGGALPTI